jgi:hypothetical protein
MKKITEIYEEFTKRKDELSRKQNEYNNLSQISALDTSGEFIYNQIQVLKGYLKALEWVISKNY